jgi:hypothetical protein
VCGQLHAPGRFTPGERALGNHWVGGWVDPRAGLDDLEKRKFLILPRLELRPLGRPARSQSLYRLRYPDSITLSVEIINSILSMTINLIILYYNLISFSPLSYYCPGGNHAKIYEMYSVFLLICRRAKFAKRPS